MPFFGGFDISSLNKLHAFSSLECNGVLMLAAQSYVSVWPDICTEHPFPEFMSTLPMLSCSMLS